MEEVYGAIAGGAAAIIGCVVGYILCEIWRHIHD